MLKSAMAKIAAGRGNMDKQVGKENHNFKLHGQGRVHGEGTIQDNGTWIWGRAWDMQIKGCQAGAHKLCYRNKASVTGGERAVQSGRS